ncbi:MAG: alpha-amylase [Candidatus Spechtbacteria bacterium]|nr:alpha-amylase [Candidatus Spechtbacteria bacterium]
MYHLYPYSFMDTNGDGIGDLEGIIQKIDYLKDLGIGAVWITPFFPSAWEDYGYDVTDYCDIDPRFGTMETFLRLLFEAHRRNIKIILDFVPNHTSNLHPWFLESKSGRLSPKRDWYIWADPRPCGGAPSEHQSVFGGSAWEFDSSCGQYYFHYFYKEQPDLNWRNPEVRRAMNEVLHFWLKRGVDGFRFDAVKHLSEKFLGYDSSSFPARVLTEAERQDIFREWRKIVDSYGGVALGEGWETDLSKWIKYYGDNLDAFHLPLNFFLMKTDWQASNIRKIVDEVEAALPRGAWANWALGNIDISRFSDRYGREFERLGAMLLLTLRGTPIIYYGEEIGMRDTLIPKDRTRDRWGRDPERTPMQWNDSRYAGFSSVEPWLPVHDNRKRVNVRAQDCDPTSLFSLYKKLILLRKSHAALQKGDYRSVGTSSESCFAYIRGVFGQRFLVVLNFSGETQYIKIEDLDSEGLILLSTLLDREEACDLSRLSLRPYEGCLVEMASDG